MQDEEIDNMDELIKAASESYHPVYDDKAWEKMEALLDKHLPLKGNRKKPVVFFLLFLLIGGAIFFGISHQWGNKAILHGNAIESKKGRAQLKNIATRVQPADSNFLAKNHPANKYKPTIFLPVSGYNDNSKDFKKRPPAFHFTTKGGFNDSNGVYVENNLGSNKKGLIKSDKAFPNESYGRQSEGEEKVGMPKMASPDVIKYEPIITSVQALKNDKTFINDSAAKVAAKISTNASILKPVANLPANKKSKKGFANNFAITLSAGSDISFVSLGDAGKGRLDYGAGLRYSITKRITVSSGFYVAQKIYSAKPTDYHPPLGYWTYNANMQRIDADCKVYEIPLAATYNFKQSKKHNWLAGIGLSTLLMKRETYNYLYKDAWGQSMQKRWTLRNKNKHYFSVLTVSGGYQYQVNQNFSIIAEPYLKLPLQGIGFGKINLNSGGVLMTASIKPFAKRK